MTRLDFLKFTIEIIFFRMVQRIQVLPSTKYYIK